jgi:hypothetical protein
MVECAGDYRREVMAACDVPQPLANAQQLARPEQFITTIGTWEFHKQSLQGAKRPTPIGDI